MDVSIVIPTLNEESYIEACLSSIYSQDSELDFEVIVVDGGSEDRTYEIARDLADKVVVSEQRGTGAQRNRGAAEARSEHLLFLDADTLLLPDYLETAHKRFQEDRELLGFSSAFLFPEKTPMLIFSAKVMNAYFAVRDRLKRTTLPGFNINIRRGVFRSLGGFKNVPLEDIEMSIQLRRMGKIRYFTDFYVITSSRRLEKMGLLGSIRYYIEMDLARKNPMLKDSLLYSDYFSCRVRNSDIQRAFEKAFNTMELAPKTEFSVKEHVKERIEGLGALWEVSPRELLRETLLTSKLLADIGFRERIERMDVDNAIGILKEKLRSIRERASEIRSFK